MKKIIIYVSGSDRVGIISDITKEINSLNGNIETSKMIKLGQDFNMLVLVSLNPENIKTLEKSLSKYNDLSITIKQTSLDEFNTKDKFVFILKGADNEGIVHHCTQLFLKLNVNIIDLETKLLNAPTTGSPLFYIKSIILIPKGENIMNKVKEGIINIENEKNVVVKLSKYDSSLNY